MNIAANQGSITFPADATCFVPLSNSFYALTIFNTNHFYFLLALIKFFTNNLMSNSIFKCFKILFKLVFKV